MISCPRPSAGRYISGSDHRTAPIIIFYRAGPPAHEVAPSIYRSGSCGDGVARYGARAEKERAHRVHRYRRGFPRRWFLNYLPGFMGFILNIVRWPVMLVLVAVALAVIYRYG